MAVSIGLGLILGFLYGGSDDFGSVLDATPIWLSQEYEARFWSLAQVFTPCGAGPLLAAIPQGPQYAPSVFSLLLGSWVVSLRVL